ncbi:UNVERIFIED_CONTAM: hypothetical protein FKN15_046386 [Acipenser sinensis]
MALHPRPSSLVLSDWQRSPESRDYFNSIMHRNRRKHFGIQTTVVYWPVKLRDNGRVLLFRFQLWDCGENALRKFDHLLPACRDQTDAVLHLFSFTDRSSFDDLSNQITRISESAGSNVKLVVGTKFDQFMHTDVTERELREFQQAWAVPVFCFQSAGGGTGRAGLADIAPVLNGLAEQLWTQDLQAARLHTC